jgi:hypothetical protein
MGSVFLWPILAVWMGLAFVVLFTIWGFIIWGTAHLLRDAMGFKDTIWCPDVRRTLDVKAVPRRFDVAGLARIWNVCTCERFGRGRIRCDKACLGG